jgi:hypothetical protein
MHDDSQFLITKSVFLLTSSVGKDMAETLIHQAMSHIGLTPATLTRGDIVKLSVQIEPALRPFVGIDKAQRLASALRVLVGGVASTPIGVQTR